MDLFISLSPNVTETLAEIYHSLHSYLQNQGYTVRKQNVSLRVSYNGSSVDLVPAKQQTILTSDHSLYVSKKQSWQKTNIDTHIQIVRTANRSDVIRLMKVWRERQSLDFPSLYLELAVIRALDGKYLGNLETEFKVALGWVSQLIETARFVDPANTNNVISDDLTAQEKRLIALKAQQALLSSSSWDKVVW